MKRQTTQIRTLYPYHATTRQRCGQIVRLCQVVVRALQDAPHSVGGGAIPYAYTLPEGYTEKEIAEVIAESIASRREFAQRRLATYVVRCATFEQRYGMSTETFLEQFEAGTLGDQAEWLTGMQPHRGKRSGAGNMQTWHTSNDRARLLQRGWSSATCTTAAPLPQPARAVGSGCRWAPLGGAGLPSGGALPRALAQKRVHSLYATLT